MPQIIAVPNGSLESKTVHLFAKAGWNIKREGRQALCSSDCRFVDSVFFTRPQAIPRLVESGICAVGICGLDCVEEERCTNPDFRLIQLASLPYNKETNQPAKVVLCARNSNKQLAQNIPPGTSVYSEYPHITKRFFEEMGNPEICIVRSPGSTEGHVAIGEYQYGVCLVEQGKTLAANKLCIVAELLESSAVLIGNPNPTNKTLSLVQHLLNALQKEEK